LIRASRNAELMGRFMKIRIATPSHIFNVASFTAAASFAWDSAER
jgi:hypothetical protein